MTGTGQVTHTLENVTPAQAKKLLDKNEVNRNLRVSKVNQYARDMANGNWNFSAPIMFDTDGRLIDGQHRLSAQVKAQVPIQWLIIRNVPIAAQRTMDTGAVRSVADQLHIQGGVANAPLVAAIARNIFRLENDMMAGGTIISTEEVLNTVEEHQEILHSAALTNTTRAKSMTPLPANVLGTAHWMIAQVNGYSEADQFLYRVVYLSNEPEGSPVLALARRCNEIRRMQQKVAHRDYLSMVIKAFNYDVDGRKVSKIATYSKTGAYELPDVKKRDVPLADRLDELDDETSEYHDDIEGLVEDSKTDAQAS